MTVDDLCITGQHWSMRTIDEVTARSTLTVHGGTTGRGVLSRGTVLDVLQVAHRVLAANELVAGCAPEARPARFRRRGVRDDCAQLWVVLN